MESRLCLEMVQKSPMHTVDEAEAFGEAEAWMGQPAMKGRPAPIDQPSDGGKARIGGKGPDSGQVGEGADFWGGRRRTPKRKVCY